MSAVPEGYDLRVHIDWGGNRRTVSLVKYGDSGEPDTLFTVVSKQENSSPPNISVTSLTDDGRISYRFCHDFGRTAAVVEVAFHKGPNKVFKFVQPS